MSHYFPEDGSEKSPISLKKDSVSLSLITSIEKSFYKSIPSIFNEINPYILNWQEGITEIWKDLR